LLLAESGEFDGFDTRDVLVGLRGVCGALDDFDYMQGMEIDRVAELARAAMVLSAILYSREVDA
jgi:hypothetical protein